jgi:hypothetical protein
MQLALPRLGVVEKSNNLRISSEQKSNVNALIGLFNSTVDSSKVHRRDVKALDRFPQLQ